LTLENGWEEKTNPNKKNGVKKYNYLARKLRVSIMEISILLKDSSMLLLLLLKISVNQRKRKKKQKKKRKKSLCF
jgi:hypothetical protein